MWVNVVKFVFKSGNCLFLNDSKNIVNKALSFFGGIAVLLMGFSSISSIYIDIGNDRTSHGTAANLFVSCVIVRKITVWKCEV